MDLKPYIALAINKRDLSAEQAEAAMRLIMEGAATPAQIGSYLTALRMKGETWEEIAGSAAAMLAHVVPVYPARAPGEPLYDVVGTGGDGRHTFNISTTAAFVVAGAGGKVAKHGNRAASSQSGSADVLAALGGNLDLSPAQIAACIDEVGIGFLFAVKHHPAMRHAIGPRREIGQRTIFNILGPLTNPAGADQMTVGVYAPELVEPLARVLGRLGKRAAYVVHGADGLDEFSTTGVNQVAHLHNGAVRAFALDPAELGLPRATLADLVGGDAETNAAMTRAILDGRDRGPRRDIVLLNAAAALSAADGNWPDGLARARAAVDGGAARACLDAWVAKTQSFHTAERS